MQGGMQVGQGAHLPGHFANALPYFLRAHVRAPTWRHATKTLVVIEMYLMHCPNSAPIWAEFTKAVFSHLGKWGKGAACKGSL